MSDFNPYEHGLATTPAELALPYVAVVDTSNDMDSTDAEKQALADLDRLVGIGGMNGSYFTQTGNALAVPVSFASDEPVTYFKFDGLTFEGELATYSIVKIGRIIGARSVRSLCLTFDQVTLLPFFDTLPDDQLLHVPVLAVDSMERVGH